MVCRALLVSWLSCLSCTAYSQERTEQEELILKEMRERAREQGVALTPEMEQMALNSVRSMQAQALGLQAAASLQAGAAASKPSETAPPSTPERVITDPEPNAGQHSDQEIVIFEDGEGGFKANGNLWIDPEGEIPQWAGSPWTGDVTYYVSLGNNRFLVKHANALALGSSRLVGELQISSDGARQEFVGSDGQRLAGQELIPVGKGLIAHRAGAVFYLKFGEQIKSTPMPQGFAVSRWQPGDVSGTQHLMIYRTFQDPNPFSGLMKNKRQDLAFLNLQTGSTVPTSVSGGDIVDGARLYDDLNQPDFRHLQWRARWYMTKSGPIAMVREDGPSRFTVIHLGSGKRATAFERKAGLGPWSLHQLSGGELRFEGNWAFKRHSIDDVTDLLKQ
jgi:hypothetical protein